MIRRDYFMRMAQELTQVLARILFLKKAQDYPRALDEIEKVLTQFWKLTPEQIKAFSLEHWIAQCRQEQGPMGEKLAVLANLFIEQTELCILQGDLPESQRIAALGLGLCLEAAASPDTMVSVDLLEKIEQLIEQTEGFPKSAEVLKRLLSYYETRGMLSKAEDMVFDWLETGDPNAPPEGKAFYERVARKSDEELEHHGLPRAEVEQGKEELWKRAGTRRTSPSEAED